MMADESAKKEVSGEAPNNVLPLRQKTASRGRKNESAELPPAADFAELARRLEERIGKIESEVKGSFDLLEKDIQRIVRTKSAGTDEKLLRTELQSLSQKLENRFSKTLSLLAQKETSKNQKDNIELIRRPLTQLVQLLSFDFYKKVIKKLGYDECEEEIDPFGMDAHLIEKIKPIFDFLYYKYWRVVTTGIAHLPNEGRALIVANHSGGVPYDGAMIKAAILNEHPTRKDARFLVENFVYHMPILGTFIYRIGGVRACPENAERLLRQDHFVIVFPEGVKGIGKYYSERYKLQRFGRGGFIKLCMNTQSPLIPVAVVGAEEIHPIIFKSNVLAKTIGVPYIPITPTFPWLGLLGCIPFPSKWFIHFGEPVTFSQYGPEVLQDELLIHKLSEKVRSQIQTMIFDLLKKRRSVWSG